MGKIRCFGEEMSILEGKTQKQKITLSKNTGGKIREEEGVASLSALLPSIPPDSSFVPAPNLLLGHSPMKFCAKWQNFGSGLSGLGGG